MRTAAVLAIVLLGSACHRLVPVAAVVVTPVIVRWTIPHGVPDDMPLCIETDLDGQVNNADALFLRCTTMGEFRRWLRGQRWARGVNGTRKGPRAKTGPPLTI